MAHRRHTRADVNPHRAKVGSIYIFKDWLQPAELQKNWTEKEARTEAMRRYMEAVVIRRSRDVRIVGYPSDYDPRLLTKMKPLKPKQKAAEKPRG